MTHKIISSVNSVVAPIALKNFTCQFHVQPRYFNFIFEGKKTVEGRVAREKYRALRPGDLIQFLTQEKFSDPTKGTIEVDRSLEARIVSLEHFPSFSEMLTFYGLKNCLPGVKSLSEGVSIYHGFPGYEADAKKFGTIGIEIEVEPQ